MNRAIHWMAVAAFAGALALALSVHTRADKPCKRGSGDDSQTMMVMRTSSPGKRLIVVDTKRQTILSYGHTPQKGLRLMSAHGYEYDIEFVDFDGTGRHPDGVTHCQVRQFYEQYWNPPAVENAAP